MDRSVSIVICTYNRADSLGDTLRSLRGLHYPTFEVIVVQGPCTDHTNEVVAEFRDDIKLVVNPERNLSVSRNLGIAAAAGDIVAFIDDDAIPDSEWLNELVDVFDQTDVAGTGGPVYDHTGCRLQARYSLANRWGDAVVETEPRRLDHLGHPDAWRFAYTIGTNSLFRRDILVEAGGFDENYAFYLDETDLCLRLLDQGYTVVPQDRGVVHHKFLPSNIRNESRVTVDKFEVLKSRTYFAIRHGLPLSDSVEMLRELAAFAELHRSDLESHLAEGNVSSEALSKYSEDVLSAIRLASIDALEAPRTRERSWFRRGEEPFKKFHTIAFPTGRLRLCIVTQDYPPRLLHGIARACHSLAVALAEAGHAVHVITSGEGHSTADLEDGVWVHRIVATPAGTPPIPQLSSHLWDRAVAVRDEIRRIDGLTPVDAVQVPNWDAEGLAVILEGEWPTGVYAYTPVLAVAEHDPRVDPSDPSIAALAEAERVCYESADMVLVSFPSTADELERLYRIRVPRDRLQVAPLGLPDLPMPASTPEEGKVEILFVGRLEGRKGVDTLLEAVPIVCSQHPEVVFTLIGVDAPTQAGGQTWQARFEQSNPTDVANRVRFAGPLPDDATLEAFARCDIFVAPSRFESFGLMNLEAMRFGKPVVSTRVNGITSVVRDGTDGILVDPGDATGLAGALSDLVIDADRRRTLGKNARSSYERAFTTEQVVGTTIEAFMRLRARRSGSSD